MGGPRVPRGRQKTPSLRFASDFECEVMLALLSCLQVTKLGESQIFPALPGPGDQTAERWPRGTKGEKGKVASSFLWDLVMQRENGEFPVRLVHRP